KPTDCRARNALSRPAPGPLTKTATERTPWSIAFRPASSAASCAAKGVLLRDPLKPRAPALAHEIALPVTSVMVTIVLLKVDCMCAIPVGMFLRTCFLPPRGLLPAAITILSKLLLRTREVEVHDHFLRDNTPRFGPLRVRALVLVRCPLTGRLRRWRKPR